MDVIDAVLNEDDMPCGFDYDRAAVAAIDAEAGLEEAHEGRVWTPGVFPVGRESAPGESTRSHKTYPVVDTLTTQQGATWSLVGWSCHEDGHLYTDDARCLGCGEPWAA
jgi:hypothetical protein